MKAVSELVESAQAGDSAAYEALIQRFQPMAYATAYRHLHDHHVAQDIVQEAVIEALMHLSQLKEPSAFPGWFRQIVFRQCTRVLRQPTVPSLSLEAVSESMLAESDPEAHAMQQEVQDCVRTAVAALPPPERLVTVLFYGWRCSYREVSALLQIPLPTVKKRLYSARQKLKGPLQAALDEARADAPRASDSVQDAERWLARRGRSVIGWAQAMRVAWSMGLRLSARCA